jgi:hypothetical protein
MAAPQLTNRPQYSLAHLLFVTTLVAVAFALLPTVWALRAAYWTLLIFGLSILWRLYDGPRVDICTGATQRRLIVRPSRKYLAHAASWVLSCAIGFSGFEVGYWLLSWSNPSGIEVVRTHSDNALLLASVILAAPFFVAVLAFGRSFLSDWFTWYAFDQDRQTVEIRGKTIASLTDIAHIELRELPDDPDVVWDGLALDYVYSVGIVCRQSDDDLSSTTRSMTLTGHLDLLEAQYVAQSLARFIPAPVRVACEPVG